MWTITKDLSCSCKDPIQRFGIKNPCLFDAFSNVQSSLVDVIINIQNEGAEGKKYIKDNKERMLETIYIDIEKTLNKLESSGNI